MPRLGLLFLVCDISGVETMWILVPSFGKFIPKLTKAHVLSLVPLSAEEYGVHQLSQLGTRPTYL